MTQTHSATCPNCGRTLPENASDNLCPACLMTAAMSVTHELKTHEQKDGSASELASDPRLAPTEGALIVVDDNEDASSPNLPLEFGGYRLVRVLGKGGMGVVYEAEQLTTGRRVALKMLGSKFDSPEMRRRFLREGRLAAGVSHPNSVYVFGTEEIEGLPVITMEIAGGGTLQDALDVRGRLPVTEAVDAMLDIIDGLEAALAGDVLHRDIKPSNCFVDPDGRVKVGDFGLSVSTIASVDTFATQTGIALGTPAYASPEQLRGDELDCRSDIYSVGSTLFTLLSGDPPFKGNNAVQIVAAVLEETPARVDSFCRDVSPELATCIAKCLAKKPDQRHQDYTSLRSALLPHSSRLPDPEPAPVIRRSLAGMIDLSLAWLIPRAIVTSSIGALSLLEVSSRLPFWIALACMAFSYIAYFGIIEGRFDASVGKWLLSLRVADRRGRSIGVGKASLRAAISFISLQGMLLLQTAIEFGWIRLDWSRTSYAVLFIAVMLGFFVLPMATMRRANGYATMWDELTGSRVLLAVGRVMPIEESPMASREVTSAVDAVTIGPYQVVRVIEPDAWIEAMDPMLQRLVWLRRRESNDIDRARRDVARSTRSRWLQSVHSTDAVWDSFAATPGWSLTEILQSSDSRFKGDVPWQSMRHWLHDLSLEIASASGDHTLPDQLSFDHIWITRNGRAMLLDHPFPRATTLAVTECPVFDVTDDAGRQRFLSAVADCTRASTIPTHAKGILRNLSAGSFDRLSFLAGSLRSLLTKPARIDRGSRATALMTLPLFLVAMTILTSQTTERTYRTAARHWANQYPDIPPLSDVLRFRDRINAGAEHDVVSIHLAGHYVGKRDQLNTTGGVQEVNATIGDHGAVEYLLRTLNAPPVFTPRELAWADQRVEQKLADFSRNPLTISPATLYRSIVGIFALIAASQLPFLLVSGTTLGQHIFGYAVVDDKGRPAGRLRLFARWMIAWSPVFIAWPATTWGFSFALALIPWTVGLVFAIAHPDRGWQEQWTGTWLVPR